MHFMETEGSSPCSQKLDQTSSCPTLFLQYPFLISPIYVLVFQMILFPSGIPTKAAYARLLSPIRVHLILLDLMTRIIFGEE